MFTVLEAGIEFFTAVVALVVLLMAYRTVPRLTFPLYRRVAQALAVAALLVVVAEVVALAETLYYPSTIGDVLEETTQLLVVSCGGFAVYFMRRAERGEVSDLRKSANTDELTGLSNRSYFRRAGNRRLELSLNNDIPVCCSMLDVDDFKSYNDAYGHEAGDRALACVARVIGETARADDIIARYGGEEFVLLMNGGIEDALQIAERVRSAIERACSPEGDAAVQRAVTVSIGVAAPDENISTLDELVAAADKGMYQAKRLGKNRVAAFQAV
ncbi:MAG: GGDEF domain-containing protein [Rubrobacteraceae bacterium]